MLRENIYYSLNYTKGNKIDDKKFIFCHIKYQLEVHRSLEFNSY